MNVTKLVVIFLYAVLNPLHAESYKGPIIDMHIHAYEAGFPLLGMKHPPTLRDQVFEGVTNPEELKQQVLRRFKKHNIVKAIVTDGELWQKDAPDVILTAGANKTVAELRAQYEAGELDAIAEMAPFYEGIQAQEPSQLPYFSLAEELGIPVGFHILPGGPNYGLHTLPKMLSGMRVHNANPLQLEEVLIKFPKLKLYIMHGGWPYIEDLKALMYMHPNLYVDIAVLNWLLPRSELQAYLTSLIDAGFGNRIMYGSDQMAWPMVIDVGIRTIQEMDVLSVDQKADIFYNNAARFLGLSQNEIRKHQSITAE